MSDIWGVLGRTIVEDVARLGGVVQAINKAQGGVVSDINLRSGWRGQRAKRPLVASSPIRAAMKQRGSGLRAGAQAMEGEE